MTLAITLEAKPYEYQVEIPGYGLFTVRRLGAGTQADLADKMRAAEKAQKKVERDFAEIVEKEKRLVAENATEELATLRTSEEYKKAEKAQKKVSSLLQDTINCINRAELALWSSDDPKALEKLMTELTIEQIRELYGKAMEIADGKEAE